MAGFVRGARVYVDECKANGYHLAATIALDSEAASHDKALRRLTRPGQRRIHFAKESESSKKRILAAVSSLPLSVVTYRAKGVPHHRARSLLLETLVEDALTADCSRLVLERDHSLEAADRKLIAAVQRRHGASEFRYRHADPGEDALLWVSDMVAWCSHKGGDWMRRADALVVDRREVH